MHYTELFAIANICDIELMFDLVKKIGINNIEYESNSDQKNLE